MDSIGEVILKLMLVSSRSLYGIDRAVMIMKRKIMRHLWCRELDLAAPQLNCVTNLTLSVS
ncbi:MAG: hypothetical protein A2X94_03665 [Bdellovibrionales bacterium GWB1_55_8]|nr:MAG: hypothetical protein A2X94_03665 [Bdellovibrionales bacterium GWB1_55_8]